MDMSLKTEREFLKELEVREKEEQKKRQDLLDKERARLILLSLKAELSQRWAR